MPTTTNFGWTTPADTDLVKDGALAIRTLGNGIDTSMVDLKGGTTGQILSKASNTDMDFTWINNDQGDLTAITAGTGISVTSATGPIPTVAIDTATTVDKTTAQTLTNKTISATSNTLTGVINNTLTTTTGDLIYASSANTPARLAVGSSGQVLTVSGGVPTWAAAASGGGWTQIGSTTSLSGSSTTISSISGSYYQLVIFVENYYASGDVNPFIYLNSDTGSNYKGYMLRASNGGFGSTYISSPYIEYFGLTSAQNNNFTVITINNYAGGTKKLIECRSAVKENASYLGMPSQTNIVWNDTSAVTSVTIATDTGTWSAGTMKIYGVK